MRSANHKALGRGVLLCLVGAAIAWPACARADMFGGLFSGASLRVGGYESVRTGNRNATGSAAPGIGIEFNLPFVPKLLNQENARTTLSVDVHYRDWELDHSFRYIPVSINQTYGFEESKPLTGYAGFCITAATYGNTGSSTIAHQSTVTRFGGGLILGANVTGTKLYLEGRYEWFVRGHANYTPEGWRTYIGYRF